MSYEMRPGDLTDAHHKLTVLSQRIAEASIELGKWQIHFKFEIIPVTFDFRVTMTKENGAGVIKTFTLSDIMYFKDDPQAIVDSVLHTAFDSLLKPIILEQIASPIAKSINVIKNVAGK